MMTNKVVISPVDSRRILVDEIDWLRPHTEWTADEWYVLAMIIQNLPKDVKETTFKMKPYLKTRVSKPSPINSLFVEGMRKEQTERNSTLDPTAKWSQITTANSYMEHYYAV